MRAFIYIRIRLLTDRGRSFLDDVDRIADTNFEPSDSDILRARLRTIGVQEYRFFLDRGETSLVLSHPNGL